MSETARTAGSPGTPAILQAQKPTPLQTLTRVALSLLLLYLIFGVLIPSFADYDDVWAAITSLSGAALLALSVLTLAIETAKSGAPASLLPALGLRHALLAQESAAVVSNTIPGPSGTVSKFMTYTKYGIPPVDFGKAQVVNGAFSNLAPLLLPTVAAALLATQEEVPQRMLVLSGLALGVSVVAVVLVVRVMRSESFARRFGTRLGRVVNWARGLVRRPPAQEIGEAFVRFRGDVLGTVRARWVVLSAVILLKEATTYVTLLVSLRAVGVSQSDVTAIEVFAVYTLVRLLTLVELTPGNVGIAETLYITGLVWASDTTSKDAVVAGVFVFRMFTYLGPIIVGGGCWLWLRRYFRAHPRLTVQVSPEG